MYLFLNWFIYFTLHAPTAAATLDFEPLVKELKGRSCEGNLSRDLLVVVGLGNLGYEGTRHNAGADLIRHLAARVGGTVSETPEVWLKFEATSDAEAQEYVDFSGASSPRREGLTVHYRVGGGYILPSSDSNLKKAVFLLPFYDINESGYAVASLLNQAGLSPEQILVIVDDLTLARNQIVLSLGKPDGSGDAHNGLKSINSQLGTGAYTRLRVGVSNPKTEKIDIDRTSWVLGPMDAADRVSLMSDEKSDLFLELIANLQSRLGADAKDVQKLVGHSGQILKKLNQR